MTDHLSPALPEWARAFVQSLTNMPEGTEVHINMPRGWAKNPDGPLWRQVFELIATADRDDDTVEIAYVGPALADSTVVMTELLPSGRPLMSSPVIADAQAFIKIQPGDPT